MKRLAVVLGLLNIVSCAPNVLTNDPVALQPSSTQTAELLAADRAAANGPVWIVHPQGLMPNDRFVLTRGDASGKSGTFFHTIPPLSSISAQDQIAEGDADEIATVSHTGGLIAALRLVEGNSFDENPSTLKLKRLLKEAGWTEVEGRRGLWIPPVRE